MITQTLQMCFLIFYLKFKNNNFTVNNKVANINYKYVYSKPYSINKKTVDYKCLLH